MILCNSVGIPSESGAVGGGGGVASSSGVVGSNPRSISISSISPNNLPSSYPDSTLSDLPHHNENTWFFPQVDRATAENLLRGKSHGTFLIRKSADGLFALSIACNGTIEHCKIFKTSQVICRRDVNLNKYFFAS